MTEATNSNPLTRPPMTEERALVIISKIILPQIHQIRSQKDQKRRSIFRELIETERNFVDSLVVLDELFYRPLDASINSKKPLIDATTLSALFGNIDQIRDTHQNGLLKAMDEILPDLKNPFPPKEKYLYLAAKFNELVPRMESLYRSYLSTNENTDAFVEKLKKENKAFAKFLSAALFNPKAKCRGIEDFLILPLQRIAGYRCLFERIMKYFPDPETEEHKVYADLTTKMVNLGATMNKEKAGQKDQEELLTICETVQKKPPFLVIMKPGRKLLGHVTLAYLDDNTGKKKGSGICYICSDVILLTIETKGGIFTGKKINYYDVIPISQIRFSAIPFDNLVEKGFQMKTDTREFNLAVKSSKKRDQFIKFVKKQKKKISHRVKQQSANGALHMQNILNELAQLYTNPQPLKKRSGVLNAL